MFDELMLPETAIISRRKKNALTEASLRIRLPWYRSLPISCIEKIELAIDGNPVQSNALTISFGDIFHTLEDTAKLSDVSWFVLDQAIAKFPVESELAAGPHEVALNLVLRIPYQEPEYWPIDFTQTAKHTRSIEFIGEEQ